jgi:hypothetical protein
MSDTELRKAALKLIAKLDEWPHYVRDVLNAQEALRAALAEPEPSREPTQPLDVFDAGPWIWKETGQEFTGAELNAAAFAKYRDAYAAGHEAVNQSPTWQPIETAPNGTLILCYAHGATEVRTMMYVDWIVNGALCGDRSRPKPTHWMPLARRPEAGSGT